MPDKLKRYAQQRDRCWASATSPYQWTLNPTPLLPWGSTGETEPAWSIHHPNGAQVWLLSHPDRTSVWMPYHGPDAADKGPLPLRLSQPVAWGSPRLLVTCMGYLPRSDGPQMALTHWQRSLRQTAIAHNLCPEGPTQDWQEAWIIRHILSKHPTAYGAWGAHKPEWPSLSHQYFEPTGVYSTFKGPLVALDALPDAPIDPLMKLQYFDPHTLMLEPVMAVYVDIPRSAHAQLKIFHQFPSLFTDRCT